MPRRSDRKINDYRRWSEKDFLHPQLRNVIWEFNQNWVTYWNWSLVLTTMFTQFGFDRMTSINYLLYDLSSTRLKHLLSFYASMKSPLLPTGETTFLEWECPKPSFGVFWWWCADGWARFVIRLRILIYGFKVILRRWAPWSIGRAMRVIWQRKSEDDSWLSCW